MSRSATDQAIIDELLRRLTARDDQTRAKRQADVAAIHKELGITDRPPPEEMQRKARRELLDLLYQRRGKMQPQRRKPHKEPLPEPGWWTWEDLQKGPTGRPKKSADWALIERALNASPESAKRGFRTALAYVVLLEAGVPEAKARRAALARPPALTERQYNRVQALERLARRNKRRRTKSA